MAQPPDPNTPQWRKFARLKADPKRLRQRARKIESATMKHAHRFIIRRWENARDVRRHIIGWLVLVALLIGATLLQRMWYLNAYTTEAPATGTTYAEGVVGKLDTINPLFAVTASERSASRLVFSSLLRYDQENQLRGDLAAKWVSGNEGKTYRVTLKDDIYWHDGVPITADDILYTVSLMKDIDVRATQSLYQTWLSVEVEKVDDRTVEFILPGKYAPFPHALTFGIVPQHVLEKIDSARLRESDFNRQPVGSGPFVFQSIQRIDIDNDRLVLQLTANKRYYDGIPRLERFQLHTFGDFDQLQQGFLSGEVNAAVDLPAAKIDTIESVRPQTVVSKAGIYDGVYSLFNTSKPLLKDGGVRRALAHAIDRQGLIETLGDNALPLQGPLLSSQYASNSDLKQPAFDIKAAERLLDREGWRRGTDGIRSKGQQRLQLSIVAPRSGDYGPVVEAISKHWRQIGIEVKTELANPDTILQNVLRPRAYDVLIYELAIGADPDVYAYWHSSQAVATGLNLANYQSDLADEALQSARTTPRTQLRAEKYQAFVGQWLKDLPAVALYQPTVRYISTPSTTTVRQEGNVVDAIGRYRNVQLWTVGEEVVFTTP